MSYKTQTDVWVLYDVRLPFFGMRLSGTIVLII